MLNSSRRVRAEQTRARLDALAPRWVPTLSEVQAELAGRAPAVTGGASVQAGAGAVEAVPSPDRRGLAALAFLAAGAVIGAALVWWLAMPSGSAVPQVEVVPAASPVAGLPTQPLTGAGSASPTAGVASPGAAAAGAVVVVDVKGLVRRPGVVELPAGSRVIDALSAAGGVTSRGSTAGLNLAAVLTDGIAIVVTRPGATGLAPTSIPGSAPGVGDPAAGGPVDLNAATLEQLDTLPGIGPVLAERILQWRTEHGRFNTVDELREVSGIGDATFADLEPLVRV